MKTLITVLFALLISISSFSQAKKTVLSREQQLNQKYCTGLFSTPDGTYFDFETDGGNASATSYFNILDFLQGRVAGLQVYTYRNLRIPFLRNQPAAVYVDEMRVDADYLNLLPVNDIAMVKVIKSPFLGSWGGSGGAIAVYTKQGDEE